ncbi:MAG: OmpA family protein [Sedimentisphaerales bacterium]|nr:OmpA family protein [Sedimentisphaerales bacterium]
MRTLKLSAALLFLFSIVLLSGCGNSQLKDLRIKNETQRQRIEQLQAELQAGALQLDQLKTQLAEATEKGGIEIDTLKQQIVALEEDLAKKNELLSSMQEKLLNGTALPVELSTMLEDFAKGNSDIVSFDANTGIVKFKSDLLFDKGSANVAATAIEAVKSLCGILNSAEGKKFDIIIAGHTDDIPIRKAETRADHPTNWHLSAHRGIAVLNVMTANQMDVHRLSVRAFGEYRPVEPNAADNKGNPKNRRVEIYIVPEGE